MYIRIYNSLSSAASGTTNYVKSYWTNNKQGNEQQKEVKEEKKDTWGQWWHRPSTYTKVSQAADVLNEMGQNPEKYSEKIARGAVRGALQAVTEGGGEGKEKSTFADPVMKMLKEATAGASIGVIRKILENSEFEDLDETEKELKQKLLKDLEGASAEERPKILAEVLKKINEYHLNLTKFLNINVSNTASQALSRQRIELDGGQKDGVCPDSSVTTFQSKWKKLLPSEKQAPPPINKSQSLETEASSRIQENKPVASENKTNEMMQNFSNMTINYAAMYVLQSLSQTNVDTSFINKVLAKEGDAETNYLQTIDGSVRRVVYKFFYRLITWLVRPIIAETIEGVVSGFRGFLKDEFLEAAQKKIGGLKDYYSSIEKARHNYLADKSTPRDFELYLKKVMNVYETEKNAYSEEELIKIFEDYIVNRYIPQNQVSFFGYRIPILSRFLEWISHLIRKSVVKNVLKKTNLTQRLLENGTQSVHQAQNGIKTLLIKKLEEIKALLEQSQIKKVQHVDLSQSSSKSPVTWEAEKANFITKDLHDVIEGHSSNLLRFIDIEACKTPQDLESLDNPIYKIATELLQQFARLAKCESFDIKTILCNASTDIMETALYKVFYDKETEIEEQLGTIFSVLKESYSPSSLNKEQIRSESIALDAQLEKLQKEISTTAVRIALESKTQQHEISKTLMENEKKHLEDLVNKLKKYQETIIKQAQEYEYSSNKKNSAPLHTSVVTIISILDAYLTRMKGQLCSRELKNAYQDVRGDFHNAYALTIHKFNTLHKTMESVVSNSKDLERYEEELDKTEKCQELLKQIKVGQDKFEKGKDLLEQVQTHLPPSIQETGKEILKTLQHSWKYSEEIEALNKQKKLAAKYKKDIQEIKEVEEKLNNFSRLVSKYFSDEGNNSEIEQELSKSYKTIMNIKNEEVQNQIHPLLKEAYNAQDQEKALRQLLYPSLFQRKAHIFNLLGQIKSSYEKKLNAATAKISAEETTEHVGKDLKKLQNKKSEAFQDLQTLLHENTKTKHSKIEEIKETLSKQIKEKFPKIEDDLMHIHDELKAKGRISILEPLVSNFLEGKILEVMTPEIEKGTGTLIKALGKPFHYKQLILRLILLDIAERQEKEKRK